MKNRRKIAANGFSQSSETTMYKWVVKQFVKVLVVLNVVGSSPTRHPKDIAERQCLFCEKTEPKDIAERQCPFLLEVANPNPVGLYPAAITFRIGLDGHEAELGTNPLALLHLELVAAVLELLAVLTPGEMKPTVLH